MPALSPTMTHGTLAKWIKKEGEDVVSGEVIAEIETDKATMEIEAVEEGKLAKILVDEGTENIPVNKIIALLLEEGEEVSSLEEAEVVSSSLPTPIPITSSLNKLTPSTDTDASLNTISHTSVNTVKRVIATPLARRMAAEKGIDLLSIRGSGPHGRIIKNDVKDEAMIGNPTTRLKNQSLVSSKSSTIKTNPINYDPLPHSAMRKVIARRLTESARDIPHFNVSIDARIDALLDARKRLNTKVGIEQKISINDFIIKALSLALSRVPSCNVSYTDEVTLFHEQIDISFAVSLDGGLITPIVKDVANKGFRTIAEETKSLVRRAKEGKLKPEEYEGGTFTISNLGMFGVTSFNSIINPPQAAILSVGAAQISPVVNNGELSTATVMNLTLAVDHRCIDGAIAAEFIGELKSILEEPLQFML
jgi:pyruvate dehydrogenase E2 component (dihydrolipoamide acetyltransferase)